MPQLTEPANLPAPPFNGTNVVFQDSTIRQTLHMSLGAQQIRITVSNAFGVTDLPITAMTVALPVNGSAGQNDIRSETLQTVTFSGQQSYTIPNGALAISDPLNFAIAPQSVLTVTMYLATGQQSQTNAVTSHPGSRTTTWFAKGNQVNATKLTGSSLASTAHWYFLSSVEAWSPLEAGTLSIVGDSITDGRGSTTDANNRWPDQLLARLQKSHSTQNIAIANQAAGGNRVLADGLGPNALGRIDRDVLAHPGTRYLMIFEGVNDIGVAPTDSQSQTVIYQRLIAAYSQIITRAHAFGIPVFGATITPFCAPGAVVSSIQPYSNPTREQTRQKVNTWIRTSGQFDYVVDFDQMVRDSNHPETLNSTFDSGDFLHPNVAGYARMAELFPLEAFAASVGGMKRFH
ncbi:putative GDSL-like Lipase/Acylhydrolase family protein [Lyophyllum shimeji]|uniref:GDSL-like Lipase/Acylhydrolase family protein n=1 Tax=Lyophyllum shimeji TaxID=47721 RepID=A0A9P3PZ21_LYOSH|nr:putative GDSL-like Lipase/Acylhydrolase family protein [Lyophyllum shimeji]